MGINEHNIGAFQVLYIESIYSTCRWTSCQFLTLIIMAKHAVRGWERDYSGPHACITYWRNHSLTIRNKTLIFIGTIKHNVMHVGTTIISMSNAAAAATTIYTRASVVNTQEIIIQFHSRYILLHSQYTGQHSAGAPATWVGADVYNDFNEPSVTH